MIKETLPDRVVCQPGTADDTDWIALYESAFPADERDKIEDVLEGIENGDYLLHRTTDESGKLLTFSLTEVVEGDFALLSYLATEEDYRCHGIGSQHLSKLVGLLQEEYTDHCTLVLEIESSIDEDMKALGLTDDVKSLRKRRRGFYLRHNFQLHSSRYLMPNLEDEDAAPLPGEFLFFDYGRRSLDLTEIIRTVYADIYELDDQEVEALMELLDRYEA